MKYKLVCVDMDGTLLGKNKTIPKRNIDVIRKADKLGVKVMLTTGRGYLFAEEYRNILGVDTPVISSNGAYIVEDNEVIFKKTLDINTSIEIIKVLRKYKMRSFIHTSEGVVYSTKDIPGFLARKFLSTNLIEVEKIEKAIPEMDGEILKFVGIAINPRKLEKVKGILREIPNVEVVSSSKFNCEIMVKGASKGEAVEFMAKRLNIPREEVMCIGDNENDISMFKYAACAVAMENGTDKAKEASDFVTTSNTKSGVANAIEKLILKNE